MKHHLLPFGLGLAILGGAVVAIHGQSADTIANPQPQMVSARFSALGLTVPTLKDSGGLFVNPASIGQIDSMPVSVTNQAFLGGYYGYQVVNIAWPFEIQLGPANRQSPQKFQVGFSYGAVSMQNIPETASFNNRIVQIGQYSAGFGILNGTLATEFYDTFGMNVLSLGASSKLFNQYIKDQNRYAFGVDVGAIGTYYFDKYDIDKIHIGASVVNLLSTGMTWPDSKREAYLPFEVYLGARADMFDDTLSVFAQNEPKGLSVGTEYLLQNNFTVRGSTNFSDISLGLGLQFENLAAGILDDSYSLRFDYTYTQYTSAIDSDPTNAFSLTVLGSSRPKTPRILAPQNNTLTQQTNVTLSGIGPKETSIRIYNNGSLSRTTHSDRFGNWNFPGFPLKEGENKITITAYAIDKEVSIDSEPVSVYSDTTVPSMSVVISPRGVGTVQIIVNSNEKLSQIDSGLDGASIEFKKDSLLNRWTAIIPMSPDLKPGLNAPAALKTLQLFAVDEAGNQTKVENFPFFMSLSFPTDKYVHYRDSLRLIGKSSPAVQSIDVNGETVYIDKDYNFSVAKGLKPGKNLLKVVANTAGDPLEYRLRVLRLVTYPDLTREVKERREIEFLSTLGVLDGELDGKFYPERDVTRRYIVRTMVKILKLPLEKVTLDLFPDVNRNDPDASYIQAAIQNGLIFAMPDGTFKPDRPLTLSEAMFLLSNARIVDEQSVTDSDGYVKRRELAQQLAYSPRYEVQIERLIDWEKGYQ